MIDTNIESSDKASHQGGQREDHARYPEFTHDDRGAAELYQRHDGERKLHRERDLGVDEKLIRGLIAGYDYDDDGRKNGSQASQQSLQPGGHMHFQESLCW